FFSKGGMPPESSDCMYWSWKNCPKAWHGQFHGQKKGFTIILEAVPIKRLGFGMLFLKCLDL
uniref:Uncharacterized protein n=1 Tax=Aegilops tauschii subsp. strangulata TaxID=200361 RepID=A0A453NUD4_AEGTS